MPDKQQSTPLPWAPSDQRPELIFADKLGLIDVDRPVAAFKHPTDAALMMKAFQFVRQMADLTTPEDNFAALKMEEGDDCRYQDVDEMVADMDDDRLTGEYSAFMDMVRAAREIIGGGSEFGIMANHVNDGGPAFPVLSPVDDTGRTAVNYPYPDSGMSLRTYAAVLIMAGMNSAITHQSDWPDRHRAALMARIAISQADALIATLSENR